MIQVKKKLANICLMLISLSPLLSLATTKHTEPSIADSLDWTPDQNAFCGGYYLEQPFSYLTKVTDNESVEIASEQSLLSQNSTSTLIGNVRVTRNGQQITSNKAFLYRDQSSGKLDEMEMIGNVHLREPNTLVIANRASYNLVTKKKSLYDILYRTALAGNKQIKGPKVPVAETEHSRKVKDRTAWGSANSFSQAEPNVFEFTKATYSTCPPNNPAWKLKASHIVLDKNTGRGYATHASIWAKNVPVFYFPYFSFPIDHQRKTGLLWPTFGNSGKWGAYTTVPVYFNFAPNYDMILTPAVMSKRGQQLSDKFRYLTHTNNGFVNVSVLPNDREFNHLKNKLSDEYSNSTDPIISSELTRLTSSSPNRKAFVFRDDGRYNANWSSHVDFNYAGDDYYLRDFGSNLNEITQNQLIQEASVNYKNENWNFLGRLQSYQSLHPIVENEVPVQNQYRRLPQLSLNTNYPDRAFGLNYFVNSDLTHFEILKTPGVDFHAPIGNRLHLQPGISLPLQHSNFFLTPRLQAWLTGYQLNRTEQAGINDDYHRAVPIFDLASGFTLSKNTSLFQKSYHQTLEPQIYYTYIPYRNQSSIPLFDTTLNTLTYDQLFQYNRFSGLDRIGDTNQVGMGVSTRLIDSVSGLEKVRLGIGEIFYFTNRRVTLCNNNYCTDNPNNPDLTKHYSPISGLLSYRVNPHWQVTGNTIWDPVSKQIDNSTIGLHYEPESRKILNLGYSYARRGDALSGATLNNPGITLKITDFSFAWPISEHVSAVGRWSQDFSQNHFQNLLYGLQYDTCCWSVRLVGGKAFSDLTAENKPNYNSEVYIQFALKGLGNIGSGNPSGLLSSISGYDSQFG